MRRLARRLLAIFSIVSLLLFVATVVLWALSHIRPFGVSRGWANDDRRYDREHASLVLFADRGRMGFSLLIEGGRHLMKRKTVPAEWKLYRSANDDASDWSYAAFSHTAERSTSEDGGYWVEGEVRGLGVTYTWADSNSPPEDPRLAG